MTQAVELAVGEHNARGAVSVNVTTIAVDDESTPAEGVARARELCADRRVLGVVGHYNSDVTIAAAENYNASELAMITAVASNPSLTERNWRCVFRLTNRDDSTARAIANHTRRVFGKRRAAVVESNTAYGHSMSQCFVRAFTEAGGMTAARYSVDQGRREFASLVHAMPRDIDIVFYGGTFEGAPLLRALRDAGIGHLFATGDGCWDAENFLRPTHDVATIGEGVLVLSAALPSDRPGAPAEVGRRYADRFGPIGNYALNAYDAARALLAAIDHAAERNVGAPNRKGVVDALTEIELDGVGFPGRLVWDVRRDNVSSVTVLSVVRHGQFAEVATVARSDRLVVGLDDALPPPMQMGNPAGDDFRGFEVDLLHELANRLSKELRYRRAPWSRLLDDLQQGRVDVICSAATIDEDRMATVDFSRPYLPAPLAIVSRGDHPLPHSRDGVRVGVRRATTAERYLRGSGGHVLLSSESNDELYDALLDGRIDALVDDFPIASAFAHQRRSLHVERLPETGGAYALMMRKQNSDLRAQVDTTLADLESDGTLSRLRERWLIDVA
jgi:branched-chain amino acid transport system substrate-binding protein